MSASAKVILSPHFDDAVLSCWHLLSEPREVAVVNVFAGVPAQGSSPGWWDRMTGSEDSTGRVGERVVEDRAALARIGREPVNLNFLDEQYRNGTPPGPIAAEIEQRLPERSHLYAPAGLVRTVGDHSLVLRAALELHRRGFGLTLYADLPHAIEFGWPRWVTGESGSLEVDAGWERLLAAAGVPGERFRPVVHELDDAARQSKLEAIRTYRTQLPALEAMFGVLDPERLRYEVTWELGEGEG